MLLRLLLLCWLYIGYSHAEEKDVFKLTAGLSFTSFVKSKNQNFNAGIDYKKDKIATSFLYTREKSSNPPVNYFQDISLLKWNSEYGLDKKALAYVRIFNSDSSIVATPFVDKIGSVGVGYKVLTLSLGGRSTNYGSSPIVRTSITLEKKVFGEAMLKFDLAYLHFFSYSNLGQLSLRLTKELAKNFEVMYLLEYEVERGLPATLVNRAAVNSQIIERQKMSFGINWKM